MFGILFLSSPVLAQDQDFDVISRHRPGFMWYYDGIKAPEAGQPRKYDRLIFDICYNDWQGTSVPMFEASPRSIGMNVNTLFDVALNKKNTVSFGWGLSYGIYRQEMNYVIWANDSTQSTHLNPGADKLGIDRSIFKFHSVSVPLELRFRGKNWKHVKLHLGGRVGFQFLPASVLVHKQGKIVSIQKNRGLYDFNPIGAQAHVRLGIRNWALYGAYHILPPFQASESTKVNLFQFGLSISLF